MENLAFQREKIIIEMVKSMPLLKKEYNYSLVKSYNLSHSMRSNTHNSFLRIKLCCSLAI